MSNHYTGPDFSFPHGDARVDLSDLFAFPKPGDSSKSIVILDTHPSFGVNPPGPSGGDPFAPEAIYEIMVDTDGDTKADITYRARFSNAQDGQQRLTLTKTQAGAGGPSMGADGEEIVTDAPVSTGSEAQIVEVNGYRIFAGLRSDPFFADVAGALNDLQFTGNDFFADKNIASIVLEVPNSMFGQSPEVGLWATVRVPANGTGEDGQWVQVDRAGHPTQATVFIPNEMKEAYNAGQPADDRMHYQDTVAHALEHAGHYPPEQAHAVAATLLPDILRYDYTQPARYPENGRALTDDVFDITFSTLTNQQISDGVGPHTDFSQEFPYLGSPHSE